MLQLGVGDKLGETSVVAGQVLVELVLAPATPSTVSEVLPIVPALAHLLARVLTPSLSMMEKMISVLIGTSQIPSL